ncbi:MAG: hypothetical protein ACHQ1D_04600 [Nitrososphaerales archaeon]
MSRKIEVALHITFGNGDQKVYKVVELPIPVTVTKMKEGEGTDVPLEIQVEAVQRWVKNAIDRQLRDDNQPDAGLT